MTTFYPEFVNPYKHFQRLEAQPNGYFGVRDVDDPQKAADTDIEIRFELRGTAVEGVDYDIIADNVDWFGEPADTSHVLKIPNGDVGGALWIRVKDPTMVTEPLTIVVDLVEVLLGNAALDQDGQRIRAIAHIEPEATWKPDDVLSNVGNLDGTGQGPFIAQTDITLFPNWRQQDVQLTWDIPVTAAQGQDKTEQRLSTYAYSPVVVNEGDLDNESVEHKGDLDLTMTVVYTATKDRNFDAYFKLLDAQQTGLCWVPFYPHPIYPFVGGGYDPKGSDNNKMIVFEKLHESTRRMLLLGRKLLRVDAEDPSNFEVRTILSDVEGAWDEVIHGTLFVDPAWAIEIPDRGSRELYFTMLPMVMTSPLRRPSDTDDVHHMSVTWQLIDL